jgi:hypothetical protein
MIINNFETYNIPISIGSSGVEGSISIEIPASSIIISVNDHMAFGIKIDTPTSDDYFALMAGTTVLNVKIKTTLFYKVLNDDAFYVSISFIRQ